MPAIEIIEGDVVKVQLTSETHVAGAKARGPGAVLVSSKVVNHTRLFLQGADGKERDFRFSNTTVGVREGHHVALVRAKPAGPGPWLNLAIYNFTSEQREEQIGAFVKATRQQWIGARWRAVGWALLAAATHWGLAELLDLRGKGLTVAAAVGVLAYPLAWGLGALADALTLPGRQRAAEKALRKAIDAKLDNRLPPSAASPEPVTTAEDRARDLG